jgi:hypothetical protein
MDVTLAAGHSGGFTDAESSSMNRTLAGRPK